MLVEASHKHVLSHKTSYRIPIHYMTKQQYHLDHHVMDTDLKHRTRHMYMACFWTREQATLMHSILLHSLPLASVAQRANKPMYRPCVTGQKSQRSLNLWHAGDL